MLSVLATDPRVMAIKPLRADLKIVIRNFNGAESYE